MQHPPFSFYAIFLIIFIFLIWSFYCSFPFFLDFFHCVRNKAHFCLSVYHSLSIALLHSFLLLLVFYSSIWFLFDIFFNLLFFPSLTFCTHLVFCFLHFGNVRVGLFLFLVFLYIFSLFSTIFPTRFSLPFFFSIFLYQFPMVGICGPSSRRICL